jgi:acyl carrier protein
VATCPVGDDTAAVELVIRTFVCEILVDDFSGDDPLAEIEFDSLALEQLLDFLEEKYRVLFEGEDLARINFSSVRLAAAMVQARRRATDVARAQFMADRGL